MRLFIVTYPASATSAKTPKAPPPMTDPYPADSYRRQPLHAEAFVAADGIINAAERFVRCHGVTPTGVREAGPVASRAFDRLTSTMSLTS